MVKEIKTQKEFDEVINKDIAVVDFWATWCPPCLALAPIFEKISKKFENIAFAKANVDENQELAEKFNINAIPSLIIFKKGKVVENIVGALPEEELEKKFEAL